MERKPPYGQKVKNRSKLPQAPPLHEEPIRGIEVGKVICQICGKAFKTHAQMDRHMLTEHKSPEGRE
ncbi:MAG: hypothetical protein NWE98_05630 [Candidatus Bathyarchaeota archaeon]|nr:hypothetical protein [Candidatus Bathyarchaeota archaeon]